MTSTWGSLLSSRFQLGYDKPRFDVTDIKDLIISAKIPLDVSPIVVPIDPSIPMRPRNVAIVSKRAYTMALDMYGFTCSRALFIGFMQRCNLLPPNFDVAWPTQPYHDPTYLRQDIDISAIWEEEKINKNADEIEDKIIMEEIEKNDDVPWINREPLSDNEGGNCKEGNCWKKKKPTGVVAAAGCMPTCVVAAGCMPPEPI